jgi:hypothetical protein
MQFLSQNSRFLYNRPNGPLKGSEHPAVSRSFSIAAVRMTVHTVQTLGQVTPSPTRSWISNNNIWEGSARRLDDKATPPNASQCSRIFQVSFTDAKMSDSVDHLEAWSSRPDAVLFWEELRYSEKVVAEDCLDATRQSPNLNGIRFSVSL